MGLGVGILDKTLKQGGNVRRPEEIRSEAFGLLAIGYFTNYL